jgi:hypothetical protein
VNEVDTTQTSKDLDKKVKLIENFKIYLANKDKGHSSALSLLTTQETQGPFTYVQRYNKNSHAIIFFLSNKIV